jgi:hypothetical protein
VYKVHTALYDFQIILEDTDKGGIISDDIELDENSRLYIPENESQQVKILYETFTTLASDVELNAFSQLDSIVHSGGLFLCHV